jgi:hypothetical protein
MIALMTVTIQELMNGWGCSFEEVMKIIEQAIALEEPHATDSVTRDA